LKASYRSILDTGVGLFAIDLNLSKLGEGGFIAEGAEIMNLRILARGLMEELIAREVEDHDSSKPLYWGVKPHFVAVLTMRTTWPAYCDKSIVSPFKPLT
jgi:hypothetical protein